MSTGDGFDVRSLAATYREGHVLDTHDHPWAQLVFARSGLMHVTVRDRVWFVPPTRAIWIPAYTNHAIAMKGEVALRTLYVSAERAGAVTRELAALEVSPLLSELIMHIVARGMLDPRCDMDDRLAGVLMDLVSTARSIDLVLPLPRDPRAVRLTEKFRTDPSDKRDLETLAGETGASLRTLQRCFADETGMTIEAWRQKARLVYAAATLSSGVAVTEAALACGYDSASAFIAAFRKHFGVTPGRFDA